MLIAVLDRAHDVHSGGGELHCGDGGTIAPHLRLGRLIILESTKYPGTTEELVVPILEKNPRELKAAHVSPSGTAKSRGSLNLPFRAERDRLDKAIAAAHACYAWIP